jgi:hypothetical protein
VALVDDEGDLFHGRSPLPVAFTKNARRRLRPDDHVDRAPKQFYASRGEPRPIVHRPNATA